MGDIGGLARRQETETGFRLSPIGLAGYQRSFGLHFVEETPDLARANHDSRVRVLVDERRYGMRWDLAGRRVAVVGNAPVENCGALIDGCDEVIRISSMRNWRQSALHEGTRLTTWAGHPWFVVHRNNKGEPVANGKFEAGLEAGMKLWAASPFHISFDAYRWLSARGYLDSLLVAPPPANIYEIACSSLDAEALQKIFSISGPVRNIVGLTYFDRLLTGTRILLMLELCGVKDIYMFGFNLFGFSMEGVWFGHDLAFDHDVIMGIKRRIEARGGTFHWNEERQVQRLRRGMA